MRGRANEELLSTCQTSVLRKQVSSRDLLSNAAPVDKNTILCTENSVKRVEFV